MSKTDQGGQVIIIVILSVLLVGALGFGGWAFAGRQDYKNNVQQKVDAAITVAVEQAKTQKDNEFIEKEKEPLKAYQGPAAFGSVSVKYPKTWSAYIDERGSGEAPLSAALHPHFVPVEAANVAYALRIQVRNQSYSRLLEDLEGDVNAGKVRVSPYTLPNVPGVLGSRVDGEIGRDKQGSLILLPLRDKTLRIWTESQQFVGDLDSIILPNLSFIP